MSLIKSELHRFANTCKWSWNGWCASWKSEATLRQWTIANILSIILCLLVDMTTVERILIISFGLLILVAELLNTAVEEAVNRVSTKDHPLAKKAKDAGSAAVAVAAITAGIVWVLVLVG